MRKQAIEKLRKKFIFIATLSFIGAMLLITGLIYTANVIVTWREISEVLEYITENEGDLPAPEKSHNAQKDTTDQEYDKSKSISIADLLGYRSRIYSSKEFLYSIRYFAVLFDADGEVTEIKTNHIAAVDEEQAVDYARAVVNNHIGFGIHDIFYYKVSDLEDGGLIAVFLDSTTSITTNSWLLVVALFLLSLGTITAFLLIRFLSFRVVRPEIENSERQKQFITNASHELKTPLAVIRANTEVEQMINGENEWNVSTLNQIDRMSGLISNLVMIAKAEEKENNSTQNMFDVSAVVSETANSFLPVASSEGKILNKSIADGITMFGSESDIRQLVSLLMDNAIKYCDPAGTVTISLQTARGKNRKNIRLCVSNSYAEGADTDYERLFDRFYRKDESHNIEKGGYGIGLSIAESLTETYGGTINASWKDGIVTFTCVLAANPRKTSDFYSG